MTIEALIQLCTRPTTATALLRAAAAVDEALVPVLAKRLLNTMHAWHTMQVGTYPDGRVVQALETLDAWMDEDSEAARTANVELLAGFEGTADYLDADGEYLMPGGQHARDVLRLVVRPDRTDLIDAAVASCVDALDLTTLPFRDREDIEHELAWELSPLVLLHLGERVRHRSVLQAERFRVWVEEGHAHGGPYEYEQTTYHRVLDWPEKHVVQSYEGELDAPHGGEASYFGVSSVTIRADGFVAIVAHHDGTVVEVALPGRFMATP